MLRAYLDTAQAQSQRKKRTDLDELAQQSSAALPDSIGSDWGGAESNRADLQTASPAESAMGQDEAQRASPSAVISDKADLVGANLSGADLAGANLAGVHLEGADLHGADLTGANLLGARVDDATEMDDKWRLILDILAQGGAGRSRRLGGFDRLDAQP